MWGREFQICGYFWPPALRSRDTAHAQYDFWETRAAERAYGRYIVDRDKQLQAVDMWHSAWYRQTRTAQMHILAKRGVA